MVIINYILKKKQKPKPMNYKNMVVDKVLYASIKWYGLRKTFVQNLLSYRAIVLIIITSFHNILLLIILVYL